MGSPPSATPIRFGPSPRLRAPIDVDSHDVGSHVENPAVDLAQFRALVENAVEALWLFDITGTVTYASPANERCFGRKPGAVVGRLGRDFVHPDDMAGWREMWQETLRRPGESLPGQFRVPHQDGSWRWVESRVRNLLDHPSVKAVVVSARDITEQREAEQEILRLNSELEQRVAARTEELAAINRELEAFSYSVSHDLRTPLRVIDGFSQLLLDECGDQLDQTGRGYAERVRAGARRMTEQIDGLLELSVVNRVALVRQPVDLSAVVADVVRDLVAADSTRAVTFVIAEGVTANGDSRLLCNVIENLVGNAWKYTAQQATARIEFGSKCREGETVFFVRDDGAGFDMRFAERMFGAFQRLHDSRDFAGTGIGLATVQRIIHRHGGRVWGEGAVGRGATFSFTLGC